jgi:hypothetical protein
MPGLVPGIHVFLSLYEASKTWMAGSSPAMTECLKGRQGALTRAALAG